MYRSPVDQRLRTVLLGACLATWIALSASAAAPVHPNPLRTPSGPPAPLANSEIALANYVAEPIVTEYVDSGCDSPVACDSVATYAPAACGPAYPCLPLWGGIEYLLWWEKSEQLPALVTSSPFGTDRDQAGVLGEPDTSILFGGDSVDAGTISGGRLTIGTWIDAGQSTGLGIRLFAMEDNSVGFAAASEGDRILARPFFNAFTGENDSLLLAFPDDLAGDISVELKTETTGGQAFVRQWLRSGCNYRLDLIYGYRYLQLREWLTIDNTLEFTNDQTPNFGTAVDQRDLFEVENDYHGGEIGLMGQSVDGPWTMDFLATIAFGEMQQEVTIAGDSVITPRTGDPVNLTGGLLTQASNIGTYQDSPFTVIPEANVSLGYYITPSLNLTIGYSFLYVNKVARPGRLVDTDVNLTQQTGDLEGPARPEFAFKQADYWLQGINFGLNWRY